MAMGIGQQIKGMMRKARNYWAEMTNDTDTRARHRQEKQDDAVHQRYGGVPPQGERDIEHGFRGRQASAQDRGPSDAELASQAARSARGQGSQLGGEPSGSQQMQSPQSQRQYAQQGGSGNQKPLAEQMGGQSGAQGTGSDPDTVRSSQSRPPAGGQQSR